MTATTWIVTANSGRARFFAETDPAAAPEEVGDMVNDVVRQHVDETETDRLGPTAAAKSAHGTGGALPGKTYQPHTTPHEHHTEQFARQISTYLMQEFQQGRFQHLALVASPEFLGELRSHLDPHLMQLVTREIPKDYTQLGPAHLRDQLAQQPKS
jgi:protein required for attachment to host cells